MKITRTFDISEEQMGNLLVCAFEGGINYWCGKVEITAYPEKTKPEDDFSNLLASDVVPKGGTIAIWDAEDEDEVNWLTRDKMLTGISMTMDWGNFATVEDLMDNHDAETADVMVQYALFGDIIFC
jgi:hypothetical protein